MADNIGNFLTESLEHGANMWSKLFAEIGKSAVAGIAKVGGTMVEGAKSMSTSLTGSVSDFLAPSSSPKPSISPSQGQEMARSVEPEGPSAMSIAHSPEVASAAQGFSGFQVENVSMDSMFTPSHVYGAAVTQTQVRAL